MWYTKLLLIYPYFCSGLAGTLSSSNPPLSLLWIDISSKIGSLLVGGLPIEPLPEFETYVVSRGISSVGAMN